VELITHCHQVLPRTRAEVSSEATTALARTSAAIASAAAARGGPARLRMLAIAPSLMSRPNISAISFESRSKPIIWVMCRWMIRASMLGPNGEPGAMPSGAGAVNLRAQQGHWPRCRWIRVTTGLIGGISMWS
jgi:hypothetical protein